VCLQAGGGRIVHFHNYRLPHQQGCVDLLEGCIRIGAYRKSGALNLRIQLADGTPYQGLVGRDAAISGQLLIQGGGCFGKSPAAGIHCQAGQRTAYVTDRIRAVVDLGIFPLWILLGITDEIECHVSSLSR